MPDQPRLQALAFGDLHGAIRLMYERAAAWERANGRRVDVLLQVGDFGVYPDPAVLKPEKLERYGEGDYAALVGEGWRAPVPTYFCKGNNEDFDALEGPLPEGLHWVPDGEVVQLGESRVAFLGGGWARKSYEAEDPPPKHIVRSAIDRLYEQEFDVLVCHEAPFGAHLSHGRPVGAPPLRTLIENKRPRIVIHGHHHLQGHTEIGPTEVISLARLAPGRPDAGRTYALEL